MGNTFICSLFSIALKTLSLLPVTLIPTIYRGLAHDLPVLGIIVLHSEQL